MEAVGLPGSSHRLWATPPGACGANRPTSRAPTGGRSRQPIARQVGLLVWIDPSRVRLSLLSIVVLNAFGSGSEGLSATVDLSGIRGLGTDLSSLRRGAALVYERGSPCPGGRGPHRSVRGSPTGPTLPDPKALGRNDHAVARLPCGLPMASQAIAHRKPVSSRATAVTTCCLALPVAASRR